MKTPTDDITPVPEDAETLQTYIQDRRVIGVSHLLRCGFCAWGVSYTFSLLKDISGTTPKNIGGLWMDIMGWTGIH